MLRQFVVLFLVIFSFSFADDYLYLRNNLKKAQKHDYLVTRQNKNYTIFHIYDKKDDVMTVEEITIPITSLPRSINSWKQWVTEKAPGNTSWVMYTLNLSTAQILEFYSLTKHLWYETSTANNFLTTLLNLRMEKIPLTERKKVGFPPLPGMTDKRSLWQPQVVIDGKGIPDVVFDAWKTHWPKDGSDLSDKIIEVYIPSEEGSYPSYFPYWLQISGTVGSAKIRIVDSGSQMHSPAAPLGSYKPPVINNSFEQKKKSKAQQNL